MKNSIQQKFIDQEYRWLGSLPSHWKPKRIKDVFGDFGSGTTPKSSNPNYYDNGKIPWLNTSDLNNDIVLDTKVKITDQALAESGLKIYPEGSLAIAMYGQGKTRGTVGLIDIPFTTNQASCVMLKPKGIYPKYLLYWFNYKYDSIRAINVGASQPNMNQDFIKFLQIHFPPLREQTAIANYLDTKTRAIDKKVELLEKKITYYQELSNSLINDTVTKGLKKSVVLEENELGFKTPASWHNYRLKDLGKLYSGLSGKSGDDFNQDNNPDNKGFIPFTNIASNTYLKKDHLGTVVIGENEKQNKVRKGDLFFLMSSEGYEDIGKTAALAEDIEETYLNSFCKGYRLNHRKCNPFFLNYLLLSDYYRQLLIIEGKGFTRINLKMEKVNDFTVIIPDTKEEQEEIVEFLDSKLDTITKIIKNIQTQIITLKELRKTLINDVVTGKIKVTQD
ncbi:restriction endonuclease subunit S [Fulvivirga ulvae]|uniref:restriction endonuclease subunit S n=1 Tax=Fulvivirga ulvae TaxID=2904245 RepID=UPI001F19C039|nr:restriction endonuclease subunit S [Fulvivirga ulvae]UII30720.1 restriction endonuclease subunit S [Fulvivirga ulvae]